MTSQHTTRIRQGRANIVVEEYRDGHWHHASDILPGDTRHAAAVRSIRG